MHTRPVSPRPSLAQAVSSAKVDTTVKSQKDASASQGMSGAAGGGKEKKAKVSKRLVRAVYMYSAASFFPFYFIFPRKCTFIFWGGFAVHVLCQLLLNGMN